MTENRVAIIVAEGSSEKTFLTKLLQSTYGFTPATDKSPICFGKKEDYQVWLFPVPNLGKIHAGGNSTLLAKETFIKADTVMASHAHMLSDHPSTHYFVITDTDGIPEDKLEERERLILAAVKDAGVDSSTVEVHFPHHEIESWFLAGLRDDFPHYSKNGFLELQAVANKIETITNPKEFMDDKILHANLSGNRMDIGSRVGAHFDVSKARSQSTSFNKFISSLEEKGLL